MSTRAKDGPPREGRLVGELGIGIERHGYRPGSLLYATPIPGGCIRIDLRTKSVSNAQITRR